jgi:Domain of unknown function (DUF4276)
MKVLLVGEGPSELGGALEILVRRLGLTDAEFDTDRVSQKHLHAHHGKGQGYFKRAVRWMLEANKRGYDALILVIDEDGCAERTREFSEAQQFRGTSIRRALGVAIRTFDAWLLADEKALTAVLQLAISRQPDPESIAEPKRACIELLNSSDESIRPLEMYAAIAELVDIGILQSRCRRGFAIFADRVRKL